MSLLKSMSGILIGLIFTFNVASAADARKVNIKEACGMLEEISKAASMQGIQFPPWINRLQSCCSSFKNGCAAVGQGLTSVAWATGTAGCAVGTVSSAVGTACLAVGETLGNIGTYCAGYGWQGYAGTRAGVQCTKMCYKVGKVAGQVTVNNIVSSANSAANAIFDGGSCAGITAADAGVYINWLTATIAKLKSPSSVTVPGVDAVKGGSVKAPAGFELAKYSMSASGGWCAWKLGSTTARQKCPLSCAGAVTCSVSSGILKCTVNDPYPGDNTGSCTVTFRRK